MPASETLVTDSLVQNCVVQAVQHVFRTMFGTEAVLVAAPAGDPAAALPESAVMFSSVGFAGTATGLIYLRWSEDFAKFATGRILSMSPAEVEMNGWEVIHDAIGEVTNMTVGAFKNTISDLGFPCKLSLPSIIRGHKVTVVALKAATRHVVHFDCAGHRLMADVQLKIE